MRPNKILMSAACFGAIILPSTSFAAPLTFGAPIVFQDNEGSNTIGTGTGRNITVLVPNVSPNAGTTVFATQGSTRFDLLNLFTETGFSFSRSFANDQPFSPSLTGAWTIVGQNLGDVKSATTNNIVGIPLLAQPVFSPVANSLTPTVTWTNPAGTFTRTAIEIFNDTTNTNILRTGCAGGANICTSFTVPTGLLAPNGKYTVRVLAENRTDPNNFFTTNNRSNASVNFTASPLDPTVREQGDVVVSASGMSLTIGQTGFGAKSVLNSETFTGNFINVGREFSVGTSVPGFSFNSSGGSRGNLLVDGGSILLNGDIPSGSGGFLTVGRSGNGYADFINGGTLVIEADGAIFPGFQLGRNAGSFGHMQVIGPGSTVTIVDNGITSTNPYEHGYIEVGRSGLGRLDILQGGVVSNAAAGRTAIGRHRFGQGAGAGTVVVDGAGSIFNAGAILDIGDGPGGVGGVGRLSVQNGGKVVAATINVRTGGLLTGNGMVTGNVNVFGGTVAPGLSPGTLTIMGDFVFDAGSLLLEADSLSAIDKIIVTGNAIFGAGIINVILGFMPDASTVFDFFDVTGTTTVQSDFGGVNVFASTGSGVPAGTLVSVLIDPNMSPIVVTAVTVPEPGTLAIFITGLLGLGWVARRKRGT